MRKSGQHGKVGARRRLRTEGCRPIYKKKKEKLVYVYRKISGKIVLKWFISA
jgi:hypothetical protein